jgi:hypothetical protein
VTGQGGTPTGTVLFLDGSTTIGTGTLSGGSTTISTSTLSIGKHTINANYSGDNTFWPSSGTWNQTVNKALTPTTTTVTSSKSPSNFGDTVTFTATVTGSGGTPTGTVQFLDGATPIGTGTLSGGSTSIQNSSLSAGNHTITANYSGDANFATSTGTFNQTVNKTLTPATTTVISSKNPSNFGDTVTFTATVTGSGGTPTGAVQFFVNGNSIGSATVTGGVASITDSSLPGGSDTVTAVYSGDTNFATSTGSLIQNVNEV